MRWTLTPQYWGPYKRRRSGLRYTHGGTSSEDSKGRWPSTRPGERSLEELGRPTAGSQTPASRSGKMNVCGLSSPPSVVLVIALGEAP